MQQAKFLQQNSLLSTRQIAGFDRTAGQLMLFPDAVQRVALAKRCTAEPGSFQTQNAERSRVSSAPSRDAALRPGHA
jgi:hypothetical protein